MGRIVRRFGRFHQIEITDALYQYRQDNVAFVEDVHGMRVRNAVNGVVQTGFNYLMHLEHEILGAAAQVTGNWDALRIEQYSDSLVAIGGTVHAIHVVNMLATAPAGGYDLVRLSKHGAALCDSGIVIECGVAGDMTYAFRFQGTPVTAWNPAIIPPGAMVGRVAVICHGVPLYIPLWN